jgi:hypothetical protein
MARRLIFFAHMPGMRKYAGGQDHLLSDASTAFLEAKAFSAKTPRQ